MKGVATVSVLALAAATLVAPAQARKALPEVPDRIELGRNGAGDPCTAVRTWSDPVFSGSFNVGHSISCRGATAGRTVGLIRAVPQANAAVVDATFSCGATSTGNVAGIGAVEARRCFDKTLGMETVVTSFVNRGRYFVASVTPSVQGAAESALKVYLKLEKPNQDRNRTNAAAINIASLAPAPVTGERVDTVAAGPEEALEQGIGLVRQGLHLEASRLLNDALGRLPQDAAPSVRAGLELEAGIADSNLRFFDLASQHFGRADALLAANPGMDGSQLLQRRRQQYAALDQLNRRNFQEAIAALDQLTIAPSDPRYPLTDIVTLQRVNQSPQGAADANGLLTVPDANALSQIVIDAQANWARSVALLARGDAAGASESLDRAQRTFAALKGERISQVNISWLEARIERQRARIAIQRQDYGAAVSAYDRAINSLGRSGIGGTILAELQLDRVAALSRSGADKRVLMDQFAQVIDSLIETRATGSSLPPSIEQYLDLLVKDAAENPGGPAAERYFRAVQAVGDPATARQFNQLQSVVTSDGSLSTRIQDRAELERELTRIRFETSGETSLSGDARKALDDRRKVAEDALIAIDTELQSNAAFRATDDRPASIAELRGLLREGEAYWKVTEVSGHAFGIVIDRNNAQIYRIGAPLPALRKIADDVRKSIDGTDSDLVAFKVGDSYALYALLAGPAAAQLQSARAIIVEPSGPLERLPAGVLVDSLASVQAYRRTARKAPFDFSNVSFLAKRVTLASSLSPRSFVVARNLPVSNAPQPFIGFAQHVPLPMTVSYGGTLISIGTGCVIEKSAVAALSNQLEPISPREVEIAEAALGFPNAPKVTGDAFNDAALVQRTDLDQFQVLHFATHGIEEGKWGCAKSPPALVTSIGGEGSDGLLSFSEIARMKLNANLVVLSACDTATGVNTGQQALSSGQEQVGATLQGLVRAFLAANARAVLATYWQVSSEGETDQLVRAFYTTGRTADIGSALRSAQTALIAQPQYSHPFFWGAYFVVGDASKSMLSGTQSAARASVSGAR